MAKETKALASIAGLAQTAAIEAKPARLKIMAKPVALRGGPAIATVDTRGAKAYRTAAKHNGEWFAQIQSACKGGPAPVAGLIEAGVPSHFVGYIVRRGYAVAG